MSIEAGLKALVETRELCMDQLKQQERRLEWAKISVADGEKTVVENKRRLAEIDEAIKQLSELAVPKP